MQPTLADFKKFNKTFTTRTLAVVGSCGHKIDAEIGPSNHCDQCWIAYFSNNESLVENLHNEFSDNQDTFRAKYGSKYMRQFVRFMSAIVKHKKETSGT